MSEREPWFHYYSNGGRFKSWPVNGKGWAAIFVLLAAALAAMAANQILVEDPGLRIVYHFLLLTAGGCGAVVLTFVKGKQVFSLKSKSGQ